MSTIAAVTPSRAGTHEEIFRVYVWEIPVRLAHWMIVSSIAVLSVTGLYIGRPFMTVPGPAEQSFVMGWMKIIHSYASYVFMTAVVMRIIWMFTGNKYSHWDKFIPVRAVRRRGMWPVTSFYLFLRDRPPAYVGHNPVAAGAYVLVYGLCSLEVLTGLMMRGASSPTSWLHVFGSFAWILGGLATVRWIHHIIMWLLIGFTVHHVYSSALVAMLEKEGTIESIISGYKWVPRKDLEPGPYRWNNHGVVDE